MERRDLTITKFERAPEGYWRARVTSGGETYNVDRRWGSWHAWVRVAPRSRTMERRDVLAWVAVELQKRVKAAEKREATGAEVAA